MAGVVTERDREWLRWIGAYRGVTAEQVARKFLRGQKAGTKVVERRVRVWRELGLVESQRFVVGLGSLVWLRGPGMAMVGIEGPVRRPLLGSLWHDVAVTDAGIWVSEQGQVGLVTERMIRARDSMHTDHPTWAVKGAPGAGRKNVFPDFVSVERGSGAQVVHEVELAIKERKRLEGLMTSYAMNGRRFSDVIYYVKPERRRIVSDVANMVNAKFASSIGNGSPAIHVLGWEWEVS